MQTNKQIAKQIKMSLFLLITSLLSVALMTNASAQTATEYVLKAKTAYNSYQTLDAEKNYRLALRADNTYLDAYLGLINLYQSQTRYKDGLKTVDKAIELYPKNADLFRLKGLLHRNNDEIDLANDAFMTLINLAANDSDMLRHAEDHFYSVGNLVLAKEIGITRKRLNGE